MIDVVFQPLVLLSYLTQNREGKSNAARYKTYWNGTRNNRSRNLKKNSENGAIVVFNHGQHPKSTSPLCRRSLTTMCKLEPQEAEQWTRGAPA
mmetsp:Transcript_661/g.1179  ORF Transcript_661/g.1179 Transcript_661/m.1179 type:complete len:93 (-) Transcript_661:20-298(-)